MIGLSSLMWTAAVFFAFMGALRGWKRELVGTMGIVLGAFGLFQFDSLLRGSLYALLSNEQVFVIQLTVLILIAVLAYRSQRIVSASSRRRWLRDRLPGALAGFANGYLIAGSIWYFLDINLYPFSQFVSAPAEESVSFQALESMPIVLLGGGLAGNGSLLAIAVLVLLAIVIMAV